MKLPISNIHTDNITWEYISISEGRNDVVYVNRTPIGMLKPIMLNNDCQELSVDDNGVEKHCLIVV